MNETIILIGTPGSGKTTIGKLLQRKLNSIYINYGIIRQNFNDKSWQTNGLEENNAFEYLKKTITEYINQGNKNIVVDDLPLFRPSRVQEFAEFLKDKEYKIISFVLNDDEILKQRLVNSDRETGSKNLEKAIKWNKELKESKLLKNEIRIYNTNQSIEETFEEVLRII